MTAQEFVRGKFDSMLSIRKSVALWAARHDTRARMTERTIELAPDGRPYSGIPKWPQPLPRGTQ